MTFETKLVAVVNKDLGEIRKTVKNVKENNVQHGVFTNTMVGGTYQQ